MSNTITAVIFIALGLFLVYLAIDFFRQTANEFFNKWAKKLLWIWLPFYALNFLIKKLFEAKNK